MTRIRLSRTARFLIRPSWKPDPDSKTGSEQQTYQGRIRNPDNYVFTMGNTPFFYQFINLFTGRAESICRGTGYFNKQKLENK